jgi:hypothetical protein
MRAGRGHVKITPRPDERGALLSWGPAGSRPTVQQGRPISPPKVMTIGYEWAWIWGDQLRLRPLRGQMAVLLQHVAQPGQPVADPGLHRAEREIEQLRHLTLAVAAEVG